MTRALVVDVENRVVWREDGTIDGSPYNPANRLVSVGWLPVDNENIGLPSYRFFDHNEGTDKGADVELQQAINDADVIVAHNLKHDLSWLEEAGFDLAGKRFACTMIYEYVLARGVKLDLSLAGTGERYGVTAKKSDLIAEYWANRVGFEAMPRAVVREYGEADIQSCAEVYVKQLAAYREADNAGLVPTRDMSMDFCRTLTSMERNGIAIDGDALGLVEEQYRAERETLTAKLRELLWQVMGDTPVNLASPEQLSAVIYSRRVRDKTAWKDRFNLGKDDRGKDLRRPRMDSAEFATAVRALTTTFRRTKAVPCGACKAAGVAYKIKKNGEQYKNPNKCDKCAGAKVLYIDQKPGFAGFQCIPTGVHDVAAGGFATDKDTLLKLASRARANNQTLAAEFLAGCIRLSAIESYLASFVGGIRRGVQANWLLHPKFNQCVTSTGRLSSSEPNLQNFPRAKTFPVRRCIVSRFPGGTIMEADFSQLEYRIAGELAACPGIWAVVLDGKDVHRMTGSVIFRCDPEAVTDDQRTASKAYTFQPLYGGTGFDEPEHVQAYFRSFATTLYPGVGEWHKRLAEEALTKRKLRIPTGREYAFPDVRRTPYGCTHATMIKNYPVQGYATADIVPLAVIRTERALRAMGLRSLLINTVHDSIVVDVYPGEEAACRLALTWAMLGVKDELRARYGVNMLMPLACEIKRGPNWLESKVEPAVDDWTHYHPEPLPLAA